MKVGEADHAFHLCQHLSQRGLDVHVLTTKREVLSAPVSFAVHSIMSHWSWVDLPCVARFIRRCSPDAVLLIFTDRDYDYHPMIMFAPLVSKLLAPRATFVTQLETQFLSRKVSVITQASLKIAARCLGPDRLDYAYGTLVCGSDRVILLSEDHREKFSDTFAKAKNKIAVLPPPPMIRVVDSDEGLRQRGRDCLGVKPQDFLLAYFGYIYPDKGLETLLKALALVKKRRSNVRLVMIGASLGAAHASSYLATIHKLADESGVRDDILWTGEYEPDSDQPSMCLRAADACVLPFDHGVTLNRSSVAASAAHGLPIITTRGEKIESPFEDRKNVLLCPPRNPQRVAAAVEEVIADAELRNRLRRGALDLARQFFNWETTVSRTIEALGA